MSVTSLRNLIKWLRLATPRRIGKIYLKDTDYNIDGSSKNDFVNEKYTLAISDPIEWLNGLDESEMFRLIRIINNLAF